MASAGGYEVQVHLIDGQTIEYRVSDETAQQLAAGSAWSWPAGTAEEDKPIAAVFSTIAHRMQKPDGFVSATSADGRTWLIPVKSILAFNVRDRARPDALPPRLGFVPPTVERSDPKAK